MAKRKPSEINQRRITLQIFLQSNTCVTAAQIRKLPIYQSLNLAKNDVNARIYEDIKILRDSGIDIVGKEISGIHYYYIDSGDEVPLNFTDGIDVTLLRTILHYHYDSEQVQYAQSGVNKLISNARFTDQKISAHPQLSATLPKGAFIPQISQAISKSNGISFAYYSPSERKSKDYQIIPQALEIHFESFYLRGYKITKNELGLLIINSEPHIFRTSRILTEPIPFSLPNNFSLKKHLAAVDTKLNSESQENLASHVNLANQENHNDSNLFTEKKYFSQLSTVIAIKNTADIPLIHSDLVKETTDSLQSLAGYRIFQLRPMYYEDIFELLSFYGEDVKLLAPQHLVEEFSRRLAKIAQLNKQIESSALKNISPKNSQNSTNQEEEEE